MKTRRRSEPAIFTPRTLIVCAFFVAASLLAYLALGTRAVTAQNEVWRSKVDPGVYAAASVGESEFIVYMAQQADLSGASALRTKEEKGTFVYQQLMSLAEATQPPVRALLTQNGAQHRSFWISNAIWARGNLAAVRAVASRAEVHAIQPVGKGSLKLPPPEEAPASTAQESDPASTEAINALGQGVAKVNANGVWALGYRGHGVVVAGADTGVRFTHAALRKQYRGWGGSAAASAHDYNWGDAIKAENGIVNPANACNPGGPAGAGQPSPEPCDDDTVLGGGHGSHTVGTMVGDDGGANQIGMAPEAKWIACRNMNNGVGIVPTYLDCMQWFLAPTKIDGTSPNPTKAPHVINNSWGCVEGCPPEPNPLRDTLQASRAAGIVYVVSAGNDGPTCGTIHFPLARYPESFTVGSTSNLTDAASGFSSRGPSAADPENPGSPTYRKPNISAPGSGVTGNHIRSALRADDNSYGSLQGTSMAGPHVAGLVALIISANPALEGNVDRIEDIIEQSAVKKTTTEGCGMDTNMQVPNNTYGWGRIDALAAVNRALADASPVPVVGIVSRKAHLSATREVDLPLDGVGIEPRNGQAGAGEHSIVFKFANAIAHVGGAAVTSGNGNVASHGPGSNPTEYVVNLSGVSDDQTLRLTLSAVTDAADNSSPSMTVSIGFLIGDTSGDRTVNAGDAQQTRTRSGEETNASNLRSDVNLDGAVNSGDAFIVRGRSGNSLD